uniref:non-specific serine/threonine protein kinase n=1 Tax=Branchiostoma floridae TaxID=7739 RepID=C3Y3G9_BRAFL|eukprot:XP_002609226.1 hypothetical protein BRAFLDRAFT_125973 [Branchiostoma floridae]
MNLDSVYPKIYLYENFETAARKYLVLEYAEKGQLSVFVHRYRVRRGIGLHEDLARRFTNQLVDGLTHVHGHGFVHRDIKDENILLDSEFNVKISDFGFATRMTKGYMREYGPIRGLETFCGSMEYMAPEILRAEPYDDAKYLAEKILRVDTKRRPSLKQISTNSWLRRPYVKSEDVPELVVFFKEHCGDTKSPKSSDCNAENIRQVDDEEAVQSDGEGGAESSSDAGSFKPQLGPQGLDADLDGRKAPSPLNTTPEELSQDEPYGKPTDPTANSTNARNSRRERKRVGLDKTSERNGPEESAQQLKKEGHNKIEHQDQKQRRRAKSNTKQNTKNPESGMAKEEDNTVAIPDRKVSEKEVNKQRKTSEDGTKVKSKMAPPSDGQVNHISADNRKSIKRKESRGQRINEVAEKHTKKELHEPSTDDHVTVTRKNRGSTLKKKNTKRVGDGKRFQAKKIKTPDHTFIEAPVHTAVEASVHTAVESIQDDYDYSDDFEEDSEDSASSLVIEDTRDHKTTGVQLTEKQDKVQHHKKSVPERREKNPKNITLKKKRSAKTALSSIKSKASEPAMGRLHSSGKARVVRGVKSDHASAWCSKKIVSSAETLSPPPEELITAGDGKIEDIRSEASSFDLEEEDQPCAAVPLKGKRGSSNRVWAVTKNNKKVARLTGKRSEGAVVGGRNIKKRDRKARKKLGNQRRNRDEKVEADRFLPPIDTNWKAGQLVAQLPPMDAKPAGDVQRFRSRMLCTPHAKTGRIQTRGKSSDDAHLSRNGGRNRLSAWP